jgi:hypothetical protein
MTAFRWPEPVTVVIAITTLAAVLRFATLDVQSVWLDEAIAMRLVGRSFGGMVAHLSSNQSTPPLYYFLAWPWTRIFGSDVVGFRSFSALVGTATVPLFYFAGRRFSSTAGLWTAALAAVGPLTFYYSQEIRPYALFLLFASAGFVVWQRTLERPQGRPLALWTAFSALALLTHYFAVFPFVAEAAVLAPDRVASSGGADRGLRARRRRPGSTGREPEPRHGLDRADLVSEPCRSDRERVSCRSLRPSGHRVRAAGHPARMRRTHTTLAPRSLPAPAIA